jgi:hypothetical protein
MCGPALAEQIHGCQQQHPAVPAKEITTMSNYGDFEFVRAETEYRLERGRPSGWIKGRSKSVLRRVPTRRSAGSVGTRYNDAA